MAKSEPGLMRAAIVMYSFFACLFVLGRVAVESRWLETFTSWGPTGTIVVFLAAVFAPLALFGPGVLTVLLVWRSWPGQDWKKLVLSVIPATAASMVVTLMFWMFLNYSGLAWTSLTANGSWLWWVIWWIAGSFGVIWFDRWIQRPKQSVKPGQI